MPRLTGKRKCHDTLRAGTQPPITPMVRAVRRGAGAWKESRAGTGLDVKVSGTAHSTHSQASSSYHCLGPEQRRQRSFTLPTVTLCSWAFGVSGQIAILALALLGYEGSIAVGGNGFVAAFGGASCRGRDQGRLEAGDELEAATGRSAANRGFSADLARAGPSRPSLA